MRRLALALVLLLPAVTHAQAPVRFECEESAFDLDTCPDPDNPDPTCELTSPFRRTAPTQRILRLVVVTDGPYLGAGVTLIAEDAPADTRFSAARDRLCVAPPPPAPPPVCSDDEDGAPVDTFGRVWYGGSPGIYLFQR
jgi:hypothetical protein